MNVQQDAELDARRLLVEGNHTVGIMVTHATARFFDLWIRDTDGQEVDGSNGRGLYVHEAGEVELHRGRFERNREMAVSAAGAEAHLLVTDLVVADTLGQTTVSQIGRGLQASGGARIEATRATFERNREVTVMAIEAGTRLTMTDVAISGTRARECDDDPVACGGLGGVGAGAYLGAHLEVTHFLISDGALCGAQVAREGQLDLHEGRILRNPIGVNLPEGFDPARVSDHVLFVDNERNLDGTVLPVPETSGVPAP